MKAAPTAPLARRQRRAQPFPRPARRTPGRTTQDTQIKLAQAAGTAQHATAFLAPDCPARGHRVNGGPPGRRMRSAPPTIDTATTHKDSAPARKSEE